jgi:uncharacterized protein
MRYTQGSLGRVFVAKLDDGDAIYDSILEIASKEGIKSAAVMAVGGIRSGKVVTGPENPNSEVVPIVSEFDDARELIGFGTIFPTDGKPSLHMHAGIGNHEHVMVGCPRIAANVYLVLEVVIIELVGIEATREYDAKWAVHVLSLAGVKCT